MATNQSQVLDARPGAIWQPRTSIAWQVRPRTLLRAGFGVFGDLLPAGSLIDALAANPPFVNTFQGGLLGPAGGVAIAPGVPNSAVDATAAANQAFLSGFRNGALSCASAHANPSACLPPVNVTALPPGGLAVPYYLQWSAGVERELPEPHDDPRAVRRHAGLRPDVSRARQRLSDGLRGVLRALSVQDAARSRGSAT